jgi:hypothetical protein
LSELQENIERTEDALWDIITEFYFHLRAIDKWDDGDVMNNYRIHKLRMKLREVVMRMYIDLATTPPKNKEVSHE